MEYSAARLLFRSRDAIRYCFEEGVNLGLPTLSGVVLGDRQRRGSGPGSPSGGAVRGAATVRKSSFVGVYQETCF